MLLAWVGQATAHPPATGEGHKATPPARQAAAAATPASLTGPAPGWQQGVFMEIFVRAYQDSNGDGVGDLKGLTQRLDYLKELGVSGLWLMPITRSADRDHGYATTDFQSIEPDYGSLEDFDEFIRQAHARGIGVIIDYVLNHSSHEHPWFQSALKSPQSPWRDWFVWSDTAPQGWDIWGKNPWYLASGEPWNFKGELKDMPAPPPGAQGFYFGTFGPHMPDFNLRKPEVVDYHRASMRFWLDRGLDGFRLDAVPHLIENDARRWNDQPESRQLTGDFARLIRGDGRGFVVCEATAEPQAYAAAEVCGSAFAFGQERHIIQAVMGDVASVAKVADYFRTAPLSMSTMLSNHDIFAGQRLWDQVKGDEARYKLAASTYLLQPGIPFIYYGEEIGMAGVNHLRGDEPLRAPMSWTARGGFSQATPFRPHAPNLATHHAEAQARNPHSIFRFYQSLLKLRRSEPALSRGDYRHAFASGQVLGFQRVAEGEGTQAGSHNLVLLNYSDAPMQVDVPGLPAGGRAQAVLAQGFQAGSGLPTAPSKGSARLTWPKAAAGATTKQANPSALVTARAHLPARSVTVYRIMAP
jgi:glycosidase